MKAKDRRLANLKSTIIEATPEDAFKLHQHGAALIDVREIDEIKQGSPNKALRLGRGLLELQIEDLIPDMDRTILILCEVGTRSLFAAESLKLLGYTQVISITGGFTRWKNEGLPFEIPQLPNDDFRERYSRHILLPDVGEKGQLKLINSKVLLIGAGGLGSPAALYLAAAGVGTIGIVDHDIVDRSNLQRQVLHNENRIGKPKVDSARETLEALNPSIKVITHDTHLEDNNVKETLNPYDVIVDGSDNLITRYLINDACTVLRLPNVHGAVHRFEGQVTVFWPAYTKQRGPCYRCLFPDSLSIDNKAPSCTQAGVLGVIPGVIGMLQATEVLKIILDIGQPLIGKMLYYDGLEASFTQIKLKPRHHCRCSNNNENNASQRIRLYTVKNG